MANSVDPDKTAHYKPSDLNLHVCKSIYLGLHGWKVNVTDIFIIVGMEYNLSKTKSWYFITAEKLNKWNIRLAPVSSD